MPKRCHLRLKLNIMSPTNLYAVKKFEQNEQNDNAVPMRQVQKKKLGRYVNPKSIYWCQIHRTIQRKICQTLHKTCHLRLKPNIMTPTNLSAVKKLEQTEQNDDAKTHALIPWFPKAMVPNSQNHLNILK